MRRPGLDVFRTFNEVGLAVARATGGQQQPWLSLSPIKGDFYFSGPPASATDKRDHDREPNTGETSCEKQVEDKASKETVLGANLDASVKACAQALEDHPDEPRLIELLQSAHEQQAFQRALRSKERGPSLAYLDLYPNGRFADDVRENLASLTLAPSTAQGQANSPAEQNEMGDRYFYGRGVEQDYAKAMEWYRKAADRGLADAEYSVGVLYENGWGVTKDIDRAKGWYQKAAAATIGEPGCFDRRSGYGRLGDGTGQMVRPWEYIHQRIGQAGRAVIAVLQLREGARDDADRRRIHRSRFDLPRETRAAWKRVLRFQPMRNGGKLSADCLGFARAPDGRLLFDAQGQALDRNPRRSQPRRAVLILLQPVWRACARQRRTLYFRLWCILSIPVPVDMTPSATMSTNVCFLRILLKNSNFGVDHN